VLAAIGPHISRASFEVGVDVANQLQAVVPDTPVVTFSSPNDKPHVDLRLVVQAQLQALGVASIDHVLGCTYGEVDRFFSFRRDGRHSGRLLSAIVPR
jgi:copper oxidase (laccase) domain-containing protein